MSTNVRPHLRRPRKGRANKHSAERDRNELNESNLVENCVERAQQVFPAGSNGEFNLPPDITAIPAQSVDEGDNLEFVVESSDPDGQALTLTAEDMPTNASFTDSGNGNGLFTFNPGYFQTKALTNLFC